MALIWFIRVDASNKTEMSVAMKYIRACSTTSTKHIEVIQYVIKVVQFPAHRIAIVQWPRFPITGIEIGGKSPEQLGHGQIRLAIRGEHRRSPPRLQGKWLAAGELLVAVEKLMVAVGVQQVEACCGGEQSQGDGCHQDADHH